ncbi:MAG TPA: hypothetical protein VL309_08215 [Vicinamibacterales bacterium]|nr:hypothetical protein [Vicinamibacterales bacterium]
MLTIGLLAAAGTAQAQTKTAITSDQGYAEGFIQSAFGNVTSQSFGLELGYTVMPNLQVFVEGGRTRDVATPAIGAAAAAIAGGLSQTQTGVSYSVKQPVTFGDAGVRYLIDLDNPKFTPYVLAGVGIAQVEQNVRFLVNGTDVTDTIQQFGVTLGSDLSGHFTKALIVLGGGISVPVWRQVVGDLQFRYGRIFAEGQGINMSRAGLGIGIRF